MAEYTILEKDYEYIPTWDDNDNAEEPIKFVLRYLTDTERSRGANYNVSVAGELNANPDMDYMIKHGVVEIQTFIVNGREIKTANDFLKLGGFLGLYAEVAMEIFSANQRQDSKNLP